MKLAGFRECKWTIFKREEASKRGIGRFLGKPTEMCPSITGLRLRQSFIGVMKVVKRFFEKKGGVFVPRHVIRTRK